ncbi:phosphatase PAP2 family protein [Psychrobacter sp. TAE2020]|uniref:phosphatase PAP2 family protein n=1 Tax=Psychrobacter sp. TAE2020 TaxID=2846762 RepID=UPI001C117021|nr:phosphatase PAP2 family protein [Psychrobacter sp. TAE2020]MBU5616170.1 phosphatase PAP2 family protein [Psychrobacter sp. TAE2020]
MSNEAGRQRLLLSTRIWHLTVAILLFTLLYSLTNYYSAALFDCCSERIHYVATSLDSSVPFIAAMIVPYSWSMILFIASFFMVRTPSQLSSLSSHLLLATLLAALIFYLYPARFSFQRPLTTDWTAFGYAWLEVTDQPFNQLPSLHVAYALLLGVSLWNVLVDCQCLAGRNWLVLSYRCLLVLVCCLIIVSTVFTYQHHLLDIIAGALLSAIVLFMVDRQRSVLVLKYFAIAISGFLLLAITGFLIAINFKQPLFEYASLIMAGYWLLSFMRLAWVYQSAEINTNSSYFIKDNQGKLTLSTWLTFAPLLLAYRAMSSLSQRYYSYQYPDRFGSMVWQPIGNNTSVSASARLSSPLFIKGFLPSEVADLAAQLIIVDLAAEASSHLLAVSAIANNSVKNAARNTEYSIHYLYWPLLDLQPFNEADALVLIGLFEQLNQLLADNRQTNKVQAGTSLTLINFHCVMGFSRSIATQVLYLVYCDKLSLENYQTWIRQNYPQAHLASSYLPESLITALSCAKKL